MCYFTLFLLLENEVEYHFELLKLSEKSERDATLEIANNETSLIKYTKSETFQMGQSFETERPQHATERDN